MVISHRASPVYYICHKSRNGICKITSDISGDFISDITPAVYMVFNPECNICYKVVIQLTPVQYRTPWMMPCALLRC